MASIEKQEEELFEAARKLTDPKQRRAFVDAACADDVALRRRLEELLAAQAEADAFFGLRPEVAGSLTTISAPVTEKCGDRIDHYKLLQKIGEGGCGVVYMAEQEEPVRRRVALKIVKLGMDTKSVIARFEAERRALAMMDHPNIAKVLDAGATETGRPYFVMELVRGIKITDYCDENKLSTRERLDLFIKVCQAIQHAHQKAIIHRDIKPSNILVTVNDGVPVPKVIDFGIAKATEGRLTDQTLFTAFEQFIGTPAYMSPEQAVMTSLDIDTRSDIYSLGVLLYELLAGKTPFDAKELIQSGLDEMRRTIREKEPVRPSTRLSQTLVAADVRRLKSSGDGDAASEEEIRASSRRRLRIKETIAPLRGDLDWIVMKCLEKDRTRRYETANSLATDIQRHLNSEPVEARPPSQLYRLQKLVRRNKVAFAAVAAVATALVLGIMVSTWQAIRATRAEREQTRQRENAQQAQASEARVRLAAEEAQRNEAQLRRKAEAAELAARQRAYASDMNLAQQALAANNLGRALDLLNRHRPVEKSQISNLKSQIQTDLRGWEWRYLWQQCQSEALFTLCQKTDWIHSLSVSHDGRWVAVGESFTGRLSVWDLRNRQEIASLPAGDGRVRTAFSPKEPLLAFSFAINDRRPNAQHRLQLWNGTTRVIVADVALGGLCNNLAFSDDGQRLITSEGSITGITNRLTLWRVPEGIKLASYGYVGRSQDGFPKAAARDLSMAQSIAAHELPGRRGLRVVDMATGEERWKTSETDAPSGVQALAFSPDAKVLASGHAGESAIRLWDVASGKMICRLDGYGGAVGAGRALVFWPDGKTLASTSGDHTIRLWDLTDLTNVPPARILRGHRSNVGPLALAPDGTTLVSGTTDGSVFCWDTSTNPSTIRRESGPAILPATLPAQFRPWRFAADSKSVVTVDQQGGVARWHGADFRETQPLVEFRTNIYSASISDDGRWAAVGLITWRETRSWQGAPGFSGFINFPVAFTPDQRACLTLAVRTGSSLLTDLATLRTSDTHLEIRQPFCAAYSPDGRLVAAGSSLGFAKVWETDTWREVTPALGGFLGSVNSVAFSQDGKRLATGSSSKEAVKLWNVESAQELLTLEAQLWASPSTAFSPDGNVLGSMGAFGVLHLWRAPSWEEIAAAEKAHAK